ncbi:MAG: HNH endonuclease signature motif containing protein [Candidatus Binataceae bacterium]|jgi:hypothetical protein
MADDQLTPPSDDQQHIPTRSRRSAAVKGTWDRLTSEERKQRGEAIAAGIARIHPKKTPEQKRSERNAKDAAKREKLRAQKNAWARRNKDKLLARLRDKYAADPEKYRRQARDWRKNNPESAAVIDRRTARKNHAKRIARGRAWTQRNPLGMLLRSRVNKALRRTSNKARLSAVRDLGCTLNELRAYLESKFFPGMTWENRGRNGWHIDHIKPLASFDLTDREQFLQACHYTNLQPLWATDNLRKGAKIETPSEEGVSELVAD